MGGAGFSVFPLICLRPACIPLPRGDDSWPGSKGSIKEGIRPDAMGHSHRYILALGHAKKDVPLGRGRSTKDRLSDLFEILGWQIDA